MHISSPCPHGRLLSTLPTANCQLLLPQIILFYSISYALLLSVQSLVAMQAVSDHAVERGYRAVFYTQVRACV